MYVVCYSPDRTRNPEGVTAMYVACYSPDRTRNPEAAIAMYVACYSPDRKRNPEGVAHHQHETDRTVASKVQGTHKTPVEPAWWW